MQPQNTLRIGAILLAAGESSRMGPNHPKQLLPFEGKSLIRRAVETALATPLDPLVVVTGAYPAQVAAELSSLPVEVVENPHWPQGIGTSIRVGLAKALDVAPGLDAIILMLCDQPRIHPRHLAALADTFLTTHKPLVAAEYADTIGVPALFAKPYFTPLQHLADDCGAKLLLAQHPTDLATIPIPEAATDIDTPADYDQINRG